MGAVYPLCCCKRKIAGGAIPRPYRAMNFYCPVGRGDLTPLGNLAAAENFPLISHLR